jgi:hypothetical protein
MSQQQLQLRVINSMLRHHAAALMALRAQANHSPVHAVQVGHNSLSPGDGDPRQLNILQVSYHSTAQHDMRTHTEHIMIAAFNSASTTRPCGIAAAHAGHTVYTLEAFPGSLGCLLL